ncbi:MAG TPA: hypothetical protein VH744_08365, partial [Terriglobales bacterium]
PPEHTVTLDQVRQRDRSVPLIIADGMGVDSTAMLLVLKAHAIRPNLILFADTGGEKPETYQYIELRRAWLAASGFPPLVVLRYTPKKVPDRTLEDQCLRTKTLPSLAYGGKSCSLKWKVAPQNRYCARWEPALWCWQAGKKPIKAIGYDAGKSDGRRIKIWNDGKYVYWYPLKELGLDRDACKRLIADAGLREPPKSACWFCPASKKAELQWLERQHPDLVLRALAIEENAMAKLRTVKGLGRRFSWKEYLQGEGAVDEGSDRTVAPIRTPGHNHERLLAEGKEVGHVLGCLAPATG